MIQLCLNNPDLGYLNLTWCTSISDRAVIEGVAQLPNGLTLLSLFGNTNVTQATLDALSSHAGHAAGLETLDLNGCSGIPSEHRTEAHLGTLFPNCSVFVYHS